ncbi:hypothetical protein [Halarcobacter sp.]|uniref:hypothetical protein n=1 Tax=Halarcobacter sp. TaxID=2321133 RepID=UPI002AABBD29|nr:hypothetical protein [Halarcobacter sp.]
MNFFNDVIDATNFKTASYEYQLSFKDLLLKIHDSYLNMKNKEFNLPKNENKIRNKLVDDYLSKEIPNYHFKKEEPNNLGRVDIYIIDKFDGSKPHFIIECKRLDNNNVNGTEGLNAKYINDGILRLIREHYIIKNGYYTNAMIGFIIEDLDIQININSINNLSKELLKNLVTIKKEISIEDNNIYKSIYKTYNDKYFNIYHLMLDFSKNI